MNTCHILEHKDFSPGVKIKMKYMSHFGTQGLLSGRKIKMKYMSHFGTQGLLSGRKIKMNTCHILEHKDMFMNKIFSLREEN